MASRTLSAASLLLLLANTFLFTLVAAGGCLLRLRRRHAKCPKNMLKLGVCAGVLGLVKVEIGKVPREPCCRLLEGLADVEGAVCLCTALKANILGIIVLDVPVDLTLLLNYCGKSAPQGFKCA